MHDRYLSNAYLVAAAEGGAAVFVDSRAPREPLLRVAPLRPPAHSDHEHERGLPVVCGPLRVGGRRVLPGHTEETTVGPDYDGKGKARVRWPEVSDAIVGGSRVERD
jgi:hypothetical protein